MPRSNPIHEFFAAKADTGAGTAFEASGFDGLSLFVGLTGFTGTIKITGSLKSGEPADWTLTPATANELFTIAIVKLEDGTTWIEGDTGIVGTTTTSANGYKVNLDGVVWLNAVVTAASAGTATVKGYGFNRNKR